jgi:superfamily II DNA or RNA helicase
MITLKENPIQLTVTATAEQIDDLRNHFRFHPLRYYRSDMYQLYKMTRGEKGWDGYNYPFLRMRATVGIVPRGRKDEVLGFCQARCWQVDTSQCLTSPFPNITPSDIPDGLLVSDFDLDPKQREAVALWLKHGMGIAHFSTNAGKTMTFAGAAAVIKEKFPDARFLYFTPSERLVKQTFKEMNKFLPEWDISQFGGGKSDRDGKDMVVCTQAMVGRHLGDLTKTAWINSFVAIMLDESHHSQSATAAQVLHASSAYYRLAASDSLKESDPVKHSTIVGLCGPVRCTVAPGELIAAGRSAKPHVYMVMVTDWVDKYKRTGPRPNPGSKAWTLINGVWQSAIYEGPVHELKADGEPKTKIKRALNLETGKFDIEHVPIVVPGLHKLTMSDQSVYESPASATLLDRMYDRAIINFKARNELIGQWVNYYANECNLRTLVVATRTTHVTILHSVLSALIGPDRVHFLIGDDSAGEKDRHLLDWFKNTPGAVLVSSIVKEGVSINEIEAGVIADHIVDHEVARQVIGRFVRKKEGDNQVYLTWFYDVQHPHYASNCRRLFSKLHEIEGYTYYYPVTTPDTIQRAKKRDGAPPKPKSAQARQDKLVFH